MRLSKRTSVRRRIVKLQRHNGKGARPIYWCTYCEKYTHSLQTHRCGERQP